MSETVKYSFVIPAYNEETNIPVLYERICELEQLNKENVEFIFINDGSKDNTLEVLEELSENDKRVKYINLTRNFGQQAALTAGYENASGDVIISLDCDLQDPPEIILEMIEKWKDGYDIVYARRKTRKDRFFKKYTAIFYYKLLSKFSDVKIPRNVGDFRLINRRVLNALNRMPEKSKYIRGMVAWVGFKHTFVDFDRPERIHGETNYTLKKMLQLSMDGMINFSAIPLRLALFLGFMSMITGLILLLYQLIDVLVNHVYYHLYKWIIVIVFIFMGFMFMLMWIIGEYIGRIYDEVRNRPMFVIKYKKNFE